MTITQISATKKVKVSKMGNGEFFAALVQGNGQEEQLLDSKTYSRLSSVEKWIKTLN